MKGQASVEALLILGAVLAVASGFIYITLDSSEPITAISSAQTGADNAIAKLELKHDVQIKIKETNRIGDNIKIKLVFWGENISKTSLKESVRTEALKFIHKSLKGNFPDIAQPVSTSHHTFDVSVTVQKVEK